MARTGSIRSRVKMAVEMHDLLPIARRYFVIGAFDGALTIMGVILGAYAAGELTKNLVLVAGSATAIALSVSSAVGAYEAERIESSIHPSRGPGRNRPRSETSRAPSFTA
jgi:VIT family